MKPLHFYPQVAFLGAADKDLQANAAGALQSVCFQAKGRQVVRDSNAIPPLVALLASDSLKVTTGFRRKCGGARCHEGSD